jgi:drug/metabolite transporter (DMT)-like permease
MTGPAAGVIAPAVAGMLYALVGVVGSITIDIATFIGAIAVLAIVRIPKPTETAEGLAMRTAVWRQVFDGFRYMAARPVLLGFCGYVSMVNFLASVALVLLTPYVLARTGSAQLFGVVLAVMNAGGIAGSLVVSAGGRIGSRMNTVMLAIVTAGLFIGLAGVARNAPAIGASLFLLLFALAFANAPFWSSLQAKIAPDLQGRVFAAYLQVAMLLAPLAFLVAGPLADRVFEPARRQPVWQSVGWLVGVGVLSTVAQLMLTRAYARGRTLVNASLQYLGIGFSFLFGVVLFNERITWMAILGMALIVGAGVCATALRSAPDPARRLAADKP